MTRSTFLTILRMIPLTCLWSRGVICHLFFAVYLSEFIDLFIHLLTYMFIHQHLPSLPKSIHPSIHLPSVHPSTYLSIYIHIHTVLCWLTHVTSTLLYQWNPGIQWSNPEGIPPPSQGSSSICAACSGFNSPDRVGSYLGCKPRWKSGQKDILEATKRTTSRCILECIYYL